jgi:hypothetical protein
MNLVNPLTQNIRNINARFYQLELEKKQDEYLKRIIDRADDKVMDMPDNLDTFDEFYEWLQSDK